MPRHVIDALHARGRGCLWVRPFHVLVLLSTRRERPGEVSDMDEAVVTFPVWSVNTVSHVYPSYRALARSCRLTFDRSLCIMTRDNAPAVPWALSCLRRNHSKPHAARSLLCPSTDVCPNARLHVRYLPAGCRVHGRAVCTHGRPLRGADVAARAACVHDVR